MRRSVAGVVAGGDAAKRRNKTTGARATAIVPTPKLETHPPMPQRAASLSRFGVRARYILIQRRARRAPRRPSRRAHRPVARSQPRAAPWTCPSAISSLLLAFTRDLDVPRAILARRSPAVGV